MELECHKKIERAFVEKTIAGKNGCMKWKAVIRFSETSEIGMFCENKDRADSTLIYWLKIYRGLNFTFYGQPEGLTSK